MPAHRRKQFPVKRRDTLLKQLGNTTLTAALAWIGYSNLFVPHQLELPPALMGERRETSGRAGRLSYYVAGAGEPLLLIHSINASAAAHEVRPLFEYYRSSRRVYAVDLPGFGFSDRSPRDYTIRLYVDAIADMLGVIANDTGPQPVDALALSLSAEFLARAAVLYPDHFRTLALVSPSGFERTERQSGEPAGSLGNPLAQSIFEFPLWNRPFYDLLTSKPVARIYLQRSFGAGEKIDPEMEAYGYLTSHQANAQNAPYAFVSGMLFSSDIKRIYRELNLPVWLAYGTKPGFTSYDDLEWVRTRPNWMVQVFDTGSLPHFTRPAAFTNAYDQFLQQVTAPRS